MPEDYLYKIGVAESNDGVTTGMPRPYIVVETTSGKAIE
jgi:hypothetical protein